MTVAPACSAPPSAGLRLRLGLYLLAPSRTQPRAFIARPQPRFPVAPHWAGHDTALLAWCGFGLSGFAWRAPRTLAPASAPLTLPSWRPLASIWSTPSRRSNPMPLATTSTTAEWLRTGLRPSNGFYEILPLGLETSFSPLLPSADIRPPNSFTLPFATATPLSVQLARRLSCPIGPAGRGYSTPSPATCGQRRIRLHGRGGGFLHAGRLHRLMEWRASQNLNGLAAGLAAGFCYAVKLPAS